MFTPIRTQRLLIRAMVPDDVDSLHKRRNEPEVARYQTWVLPYERETAEATVAGVIELDGPTNDEWWMASVEVASTGEVAGDVVVHLTMGGRSAEIGYSFAGAHQGLGYALEACEALVAYLFDDLGVQRVWGMLHPDNPASARVLERLGMVFEGHLKGSFWVGDENSDDWIYGMTREDWNLWTNRPTTTPGEVRLDPITPDTVRTVLALQTHKTQEKFVAPMANSFANALFPPLEEGVPVVPWLRAVVADDVIVGFVMVAEVSETNPEPFLWRLLIDRLHQRRGIGDAVIEMLCEHFRATGAEEMYVSWHPGRWSPEPFYLRHGFELTGKAEDGEIEGRKQL